MSAPREYWFHTRAWTGIEGWQVVRTPQGTKIKSKAGALKRAKNLQADYLAFRLETGEVRIMAWRDDHPPMEGRWCMRFHGATVPLADRMSVSLGPASAHPGAAV